MKAKLQIVHPLIMWVGRIIEIGLFDAEEKSIAVCKSYAFVISMLAVGSIHQLTVVSGERCLLVLKPFMAQEIMLRHKVIVVVGVYISALLVTAPPLFGWSQFARGIDQHYCGYDDAQFQLVDQPLWEIVEV
jgi:hypothetical protein